MARSRFHFDIFTELPRKLPKFPFLGSGTSLRVMVSILWARLCPIHPEDPCGLCHRERLQVHSNSGLD